ncbi:MAG: hypothetical protein R3F34_11325 [Planctomycetota bacterium]
MEADPLLRRFSRRIAVAALLLHGCTNPSDQLPEALSSKYPIDGDFDFADFAVAPTTANLPLVDMLGTGTTVGSTTVRWVALNDDRDLYLALEWTDTTHDSAFDAVLGPTDFDGIQVAFDDDGDGLVEVGEDARTVLAATVGSQYVDQHFESGDQTDLVGDGRAKLTYDAVGMKYRAEFLIPLGDDVTNEDGPINASSRFTFAVLDHVQLAGPTGNAAGLDGVLPALGADSSGWARVPLQPAGPHARPQLPSDLGGLIAFVSRHESENGDIFTFDPSTEVVTRVTNDPTTYKDNVSLSHDRTRIAFHSASSVAATNEYEIWTIDVDGSNLTRLTNNTNVDGHPAWSPDDTRIAYASRRNGTFHVVVMDTAGIELADLTSDGDDMNDPDWTEDGRIVFKTDLFSTIPQVRIAVMDDDGTNVVQLTTPLGVSDHDPVAAGGDVYFERFTKSTNYATDVESGFVPWNLVAAADDGGGETTLLADGYLNWLPVLDPSRTYVAHLKTFGYTEVRLLDLDGNDLGRLIPGFTRVAYLDWK